MSKLTQTTFLVGTTDFCQYVKKLPGVIGGASKETLYWNRVRIGKLLSTTFGEYIDTFDSVGLSMINPWDRNHITCKGTLYSKSSSNFIH